MTDGIGTMERGGGKLFDHTVDFASKAERRSAQTGLFACWLIQVTILLCKELSLCLPSQD